MRTLRKAFVLLTMPLGALGCANVATVRPGEPAKITTRTAVGDRPQPAVSGTPGTSVAADVEPDDSRTTSEGRISGRVVDDRGDAVPGAEVRVAIGSASVGRTAKVVTDEAGRFTLHGLRPGSEYTVVAETEDEQGGVVSGRTRARAPETGIRIAVAGPPRAGAPRVNKVSRRKESPRDDEGESETSATNPEDIPAASTTDDQEFVERQGERGASQRGVEESAGVVWRRHAAHADRVANAGSAVAPRASASTSVDESGDVADDDGPNPLPPALERTEDAASSEKTTSSDEHFESAAPRRAQAVAATAPPTESKTVTDSAATDREFVASQGGGPAPAELRQEPPAVADAKTPATGAVPADSSTAPPQSGETKSAEASAPITEPKPADTPIPGREALPATPSASEARPAITEPPKGSAAPAESPADASKPAPANDRESAPAEATAPDPGQGSAPVSDLPPPTAPDPNANADSQAAAPQPRKMKWGELGRPRQSQQIAAGNSRVATLRDGTANSTRGRTLAVGLSNSGMVPASCDYDARKGRLNDFQLPDVGGAPVRLRDLDADYVLIDFWGSWCDPCLASIPHLVQLQSEFDPKRLTVIGVAYEQAPPSQAAANAIAAARRLGVNYPILLGGLDDKPCPLQTALHVQAFPTMVLVDRHGRILWRDQGATNATLARLDRVIASTVSADVVRR
jgi:thiol-disulfide isomerase/thioredoxin